MSSSVSSAPVLNDTPVVLPENKSNPVEETLNAKIRELTKQLEQSEQRETDLKLERGRITKTLETKGKMLQLIIEKAPVVQEICRFFSEDDVSQDNKKIKEDAELLFKGLLIAKGVTEKLEKSDKIDEASKIKNRIESDFEILETEKKEHQKLMDDYLKITTKNPIDKITENLTNWEAHFVRIQERTREAKEEIFIYVKNLRKYIDYLEANPILPITFSSIGQYLASLDTVSIARLQYDVCNIEEIIKTNSKQVEDQTNKNKEIVKQLKQRHDKLLQQYLETAFFERKIDLRLKKLSHHVSAHPNMLKLKEDSTKYHTQIIELKGLLDGQSSILNLVKQVLEYIIQYNGQNPLFELNYSDKDFPGKIQTIENSLTAGGINYKDDAKYMEYKEGKAQFPEIGLRQRKLNMNTTVKEAQDKLANLLKDYEVSKVLKEVFDGMEFYDSTEQKKVLAKENKDFITELCDIKDNLANFMAGWKSIEALFLNNIPDLMNFVCSSIMTNNGNTRSAVKMGIKGVFSKNSDYILPA